MNYRVSFVCAFILVLSFRSSNTAVTQTPYSATFLSGLNRFSADFYQSLARGESGTFVSSPISALTVLAMLAYGADGHTREELINAIHLPVTQSEILLNFRQFYLNLKGVTDIELHLATKLFVHKHFEVEWVYWHVSDVIFQSGMESLDFQDNNEAAKIINTWTEEKTKNRITNIVKADDFDDDTRLVVLNAVYFNASWAHAFKTSSYDSTFYLSNDNSVSIQMMCNEVDYNHGLLHNSAAHYIELPYKTTGSTNQFSMYIIVPREIEGVDSLADHINEVDFAGLDAPKNELRLCLPKFKIETELDLIPILQNMGIHDMFTNNANFSNISPTENLKVTKVIQKAFLSVSEEGTEASAATSAVLGLRFMTPYFTVDRPFIAAIVSKDTGTPLFWARVNDPRSPSAK